LEKEAIGATKTTNYSLILPKFTRASRNYLPRLLEGVAVRVSFQHPSDSHRSEGRGLID
jgi:hypothetical protein